MTFQKNQSPWNKGTKGIMKKNKTSFEKGMVAPMKGRHLSPEHKEKLRKANIGKHHKYWSEKIQWCRRTLHTHKLKGCSINISSEQLSRFVSSIEYCEICGKKLNWNSKKGRGAHHDSPSLDRKNNDTFIDMDNIMILCVMCNATKQSRTFGEFVQYCKNVIERFGEL